MRLPSLLFALAGAIFAPLSHAATVYELSTQYPPSESTQCMYDEDTTVLQQLEINAQNQINTLNSTSSTDYYYTNAQKNGDPSVNSSCQGAQGLKYDVYRYTSDGTPYKQGTYYISVGANGSLTSVTTCPSDENNAATVSVKDAYGDIVGCYEPAELADNDSCPDDYTGNYSLIPNQSGATDSSICVTLDDGSESRCSYSLSADGSYYSATFENTGCYETSDDTELSTSIDTSTQCEELSAGVAMCLESESEMCPNGVCQSGCGTVGLSDGTSYFVCIDSDTDGDAIPDYSDTDIDGDGILNEDDSDVDGDGVTNNADSDYDGSSVTTSYSTVVVDTSGIEDKLSELIESADFEAIEAEHDTAMNAQAEALDAAADELLESIDFTDVAEGTGFFESLDSLTAYFASNCQTFSWAYRTETIALDTCEIKSNIEPYLYILFAIGTAVYIFYRVGGVISGGRN